MIQLEQLLRIVNGSSETVIYGEMKIIGMAYELLRGQIENYLLIRVHLLNGIRVHYLM